MSDLDYTPEFTCEELAILRAFDGSCRATLLGELYQSLPDVYQPDVKRAMRSAARKLEAMTDEAFDAQGLAADGCGYGFDYDWEEWE